MSTSINILIADDHPILLEGVISLLERSIDNVEYIRAHNGLEALQKAIETKPVLAILDIDMPHLDGIEVAKKIRDARLETKIVILTLHRESIFFKETKAIGVQGYVLKEFSTLEIATCVKEVLAGNNYYGKGLEAFMTSNANDLPSFTKTETHVLKLIAKGHTSKDIAQMLFVSEKTIDSHRYNLSKKLVLKPEKNSLLKWVMTNQDKFKG